uniref:Bestrophin homolog n=1 Tax=Steinernema glaseri TaxID=37863 RepID=A0A1I8ACN7_9BILA
MSRAGLERDLLDVHCAVFSVYLLSGSTAVGYHFRGMFLQVVVTLAECFPLYPMTVYEILAKTIAFMTLVDWWKEHLYLESTMGDPGYGLQGNLQQ